MGIMIDKVATAAIGRGASDIHFHPGKPPVLRLNGRFEVLQTGVLTGDDTSALLKQVAPNSVLTAFAENGSADFAFSFGNARFRAHACLADRKCVLFLRRLPSKLLSTAQIGLPPAFVELTKRDRGLLLVSGPTGSGKTTTLAAIVNELLEGDDVHVITIEEPTEYVIPHGKGLITQREVPTDVKTFEQGLVDAMREDPDVIVVGEMRNLPTMRTAITAAETGHLVLGTLHNSKVSQTVERILDAFPGNEKDEIRAKLAASLKGVLCQQLLPRADGQGVVAAFEFLAMTVAVQNTIRKGETFRIDSMIQTGAKEGMRTLEDNLADLVRSGIVQSSDAMRAANDHEALAQKIRSR